MKIKKKLNNNVAVVTDKTGNEIIVMGKGITYDKKSGDCIDEEQVEKRFVLSNKDFSMKFQEILLDIPAKYLEASNCIIERAKKYLDAEIDDNIYISLTDHIHMAVKRYLDGMQVPNPLLLDIKRFYNKEYEIGCQALEIIKDQLKVELPEDEAGFIALHIVNVELDEDNMDHIFQVTKVIQEISTIVKYHFHTEFDTSNAYYYRFITHLKFFALRLLKNNQFNEEEENELLDVVKDKYCASYECVLKIRDFLKRKYKYTLHEDEIVYLTIHVHRVVHKTKKE